MLEDSFPGFKLWTEKYAGPTVANGRPDDDDARSVSAIVADFNGDGLDDVVLDGFTDDEVVFVAFLSDGGGYKLRTLDAHPRPAPGMPGADSSLRTLLYAPPGRYHASCSAQEDATFVDLEIAGLAHGWDDKFMVLTYVENGAFKEFCWFCC